jgi:hypothetical protein
LFSFAFQRVRGIERLRRGQGRDTVVSAFLYRRSETLPDPRQHHQPWSDRHTRHSPQPQRTPVSTIPLGRMGGHDEVAKAVSFLALDGGSFVTDIELVVDGSIAQCVWGNYLNVAAVIVAKIDDTERTSSIPVRKFFECPLI